MTPDLEITLRCPEENVSVEGMRLLANEVRRLRDENATLKDCTREDVFLRQARLRREITDLTVADRELLTDEQRADLDDQNRLLAEQREEPVSVATYLHCRLEDMCEAWRAHPFDGERHEHAQTMDSIADRVLGAEP